MKTLAVIPSRYESKRFPGKSLSILNGTSVIERVYRNTKKARSISEIIVATDDMRIYKHVKKFTDNCIISSKQYQNGSERCLEIMRKKINDYDFFVNVQGDIPYFNFEELNSLCSIYEAEKPPILTIANQILDKKQINNQNVVKVNIDQNNYATSFYRKSNSYTKCYKHRGIYGYSKKVINQLLKLDKNKNEILLDLEQLRWLNNGFKIRVVKSNYDSISIDSVKDINKFNLNN